MNIKGVYTGPWQRHMPPYENKDIFFGECEECVFAIERYKRCGLWLWNNGNFHMEPIEWWKRRHNKGM